MQPMIAMQDTAAVRLSELFETIGFPDERGRAQRIATRFGVSRETVRKWLTGDALPETSRLAEMVRGSPFTVDYILTGRQRSAATESGGGIKEEALTYQGPGQKLLARLASAIKAGHIDDRMMAIFNAMLDVLTAPGK